MSAKKAVHQSVYGQVRYFGDLEVEVHTDLRSIVQYLCRCAKTQHLSSRTERRQGAKLGKRGLAEIQKEDSAESIGEGKKKRKLSELSEKFRTVKRVKLSDERAARVVECMQQSESCPYNSLEDLEEAVFLWCKENFQAFDANKYYNEERAVGYTNSNRDIQERLTKLVLGLVNAPSSGIVLDLACGSGLSTQTALKVLNPEGQSNRNFLIGTDVSSSMISGAHSENQSGYVDFVLHDMKQPTPFREGAFNMGFSVSAIHYLGTEKEKATCFSGLRNTVEEFSCQFFPAKEKTEVIRMCNAAKDAGWESVGLLLDQTHHTNSYRWYMTFSRAELKSALVCRLYNKPLTGCILCCDNRADEEHKQFMISEHVKYARKVLRMAKHDPKLLSPSELELVKDLKGSLQLEESVPSLEEMKSQYSEKLHFVLHKEQTTLEQIEESKQI